MCPPVCWSAVVGMDTLGGIPLSSSSMLAAWRDGDRGAGAVEAAAAGASDWKVTGGPGHDMVITQYCYVERIKVNRR